MKRLILFFLLVSTACQMNEGSPTSFPTLLPTESVPSEPAHTAIPPTSAAETSMSYEQYTIDSLRARSYGDGNIEVVEIMEENDLFTRYLIRYPSDGLSISGFVNIPKGDGPFPVIIAIHGFVDPAIYQPLDYTTPMIDRITQAGYIIFHPDLRGYAASDEGDNLFRVGMSIDVLHLIALITNRSGPSELFTTAASENIGLLGHSMGGSIALRVLIVSSNVKATVLYASMGGDEIKNAESLFKAFPDPAFQAELDVPRKVMERVSLMNYYNDITSPIQLHHGTADETVPVAQAEETCDALTAAGVQIDCIYYPGEGHTFRSRVADSFYANMIGFYKMYLSP